MECSAAGGADGIGQVGDAGGSNTRECGSTLDGVRRGEVEQCVQPFDTRIRMIAIAQAV
jgi:hypothetical protein